ncbi:MAG: hypothetical protein ACOCSE_03600, partial [Chitinivibrionales bacterium]
MPESLTHLINPFKALEGNWQYQAQRFTFDSIERALNETTGTEIELLSAQFSEDRDIIPDFFNTTPDLSRSISDIRSFRLKRKLPFLGDILERLLKYSKSEYLIFSNSDIILSKDFYNRVSELIAQGNPLFSINRITVPKREYTRDALDIVQSQDGKPHPGHDCFVIRKDILSAFITDRIVTGVPWTGFIVILNMAVFGSGIKIFHDLKLTRHLGEDMAWTGEENLEYKYHNTIEAYRIMNRFKTSTDIFMKGTYLKTHYALGEKQINLIPGDFNTTSKEPLLRNRYVFSINPGRAGSAYLSSLLGSGLDVVSFHEAKPEMCGKHLLDSAYKDRAVSKPDRMIKVKEIQSLLANLPPGKIYAETNHMFIKSFYDVVVSSIPNELITVVILRRDPAALVESFYRMGYFSDKNRVWPAWMHKVPSIGSVFKPGYSYEDIDTYDRIISY